MITYKQVHEMRKKAALGMPNLPYQDILRGLQPLWNGVQQVTQPIQHGFNGLWSLMPLLMMGGMAMFNQNQNNKSVPNTSVQTPAAVPVKPVSATNIPATNNSTGQAGYTYIPVNTGSKSFISSRDSNKLTPAKVTDPTAKDVVSGKKTFIQGAQQLVQERNANSTVNKRDNTPPMLKAYGIQYPKTQ